MTVRVIEVRRSGDSWCYRSKGADYCMSLSYVCADEMDHYFVIPKGATWGWVSLADDSKRPGPEWIKLRLKRQKEKYYWNTSLQVEPRPGGPRSWRTLPTYRPFRVDVTEVGERPPGGVWCWMRFEYRVD